PLLLLLLARGNWFWYLFFFVAVFFSSLIATQMLKDDADFVFYLIFTRAWELAAGSIVALCMVQKKIKPNDTLAIIGLIFILYAAFTFNESKGAAGTLLLIPVIGSAMMILFTAKESLFGKTLSLKPVVFIGLMSYSLYLWHIPLLVFYHYIAEQNFHIVAYILILFLLSYFSWRFVEKPFRSRSVIPIQTLTIFILCLSVPLVGLGLWGHKNGGFPERTAFFEAMRVNNGYGLECNGNSDINEQCSSSKTPKTAVLGNSYSMVLVKHLDNESSTGLVQLTQDSCAIGYIDNIKDAGHIKCGDFFTKAVNTILTTPSIKQVVISSNFDKELSNKKYEQSFRELLLDLSKKEVIVVGPTPSAPVHVGQCLWKAKIFNNNNQKSCDFTPSPDFHQNIISLSKYLGPFEHVTFIDITQAICLNGVCKMSLGEQDAMYTDTGHLSYSGAAAVLDFHLATEL
ncbi:acyltransferase, partial [Vibrio agarivorans]